MNSIDPGIGPRLDALPDEGKREYLLWSEIFHRLMTLYVENAEKLKEIRELDPAHAAIYDRKIEPLMGKAYETMEEWQGHRSRILDKWLLPG